MEDQVCPRCRTTKYRNPSLKLLVNVCGHSLCESCVDLLFLKGSGSCPECQIPLRRCNFRVQLFEDAGVEKEVDIRRRVLRDYNKKEEDFPSLKEYNEYLEEVEEIIWNLVMGIATVETNRKIEQYKRENKEQILRNKLKLGKSQMELEELLELEKAKTQTRQLEVIREETEAKKKKLRAKEALIDELMFSEGNAKSIVESFAEAREAEEVEAVKETAVQIPQRVSQFSTGIKFTSHHDFLPVTKVEEGPLFTYSSPELILEGPHAPGEVGAYLQHIRQQRIDEKAGGFDSKVACLRALQEAVAGLYYSARNT